MQGLIPADVAQEAAAAPEVTIVEVKRSPFDPNIGEVEVCG
jgi:hypothetical protein